MAVEREGDLVILRGVIGVADVELLQTLLLQPPSPSLNLSECSHLHTAALRVLMAARVTRAAPPVAPFLRDFIYPILQREAAAISAAVGRQP